MRQIRLLLFTIAIALALPACATTPGQQGNYGFLGNINSADCAEIGSGIGYILSSAPGGVLVATLITKGACDAIGGYFKQPNTLTGTVTMPVQPPAMKLTAAEAK